MALFPVTFLSPAHSLWSHLPLPPHPSLWGAVQDCTADIVPEVALILKSGFSLRWTWDYHFPYMFICLPHHHPSFPFHCLAQVLLPLTGCQLLSLLSASPLSQTLSKVRL